MESHEEGVFFRSNGKKTFVPLENNPEVLESVVHQLGLSPDIGFHDVYSIDDPDLLAFIPRPCHGLIFIAVANIYHMLRKHDGSKALTYDGSGDQEPVLWIRQTIGHSCGLMALLHTVMNGTAKQYVTPGSDLDKIEKACIPLKPVPRAEVIYNSAALEKAHMNAAWKGQSVAPQAEEPNGYHFLAFVKSEKDNHLYELDGGWNGPIDRGQLSADDDMLSDAALKKGIRRFIELADGNVEFSLVALA